MPSGSSEKYQGNFEDRWHAALARLRFGSASAVGEAYRVQSRNRQRRRPPKNWSLIYPDGRRPTLSPAYDLVATAFHIPEDDLGLRFNGTKEFGQVRSGGFARLDANPPFVRSSLPKLFR